MRTSSGPPKRPNIIVILADDMGYGDLAANNEGSKIPTPNLNRLAAEGVRFTDAHAASSICTPSRYALLTGRYAWRSRLKRGIVWEWDGPLIEPDRETVASLLHRQGYRTACIGKWHLGWDWPTKDGRHPNETLPFGVGKTMQDRAAYAENIDFAGSIGGGPIERGFDSYFGVDVPNFSPYTWFRDDRLTEVPTVEKPADIYGNPGPSVPGWTHEPMIPAFVEEAKTLIESAGGVPFFLYLPLTSPHSPVVPNDQFLGRSECGRYGDFVCEVDWVVGEITAAVERAGLSENTLLIFTSDNGPENRVRDDDGAYERIRRFGHYSMDGLRGIKRDAWEGGHRVPFVARWPRAIPAGSVCRQLVSLVDLYATCAAITGADIQGGEDSVSVLPLLSQPDSRPVRQSLVHHSGTGKFAIRTRDWVYIDAATGGDNDEPAWFRAERGYEADEYPGQLFDLSRDRSERKNCYAERPEIVAALREALDTLRGGASSHDRHILGDESAFTE